MHDDRRAFVCSACMSFSRITLEIEWAFRNAFHFHFHLMEVFQV